MFNKTGAKRVWGREPQDAGEEVQELDGQSRVWQAGLWERVAGEE